MAIALFVRWPRLRPRINEPVLIPDNRADRYPLLADDLAAVSEIVFPAYRTYDIRAQVEQNGYWRQQVLLIGLTVSTTAFGSVQAALSHQVWPGVVVALLGVASAAVAGLAEERASQRAYLDQRTKAERLRSLAFVYLAEMPPFSGANRRQQLREAVQDIGKGKEGA